MIEGSSSEAQPNAERNQPRLPKPPTMIKNPPAPIWVSYWPPVSARGLVAEPCEAARRAACEVPRPAPAGRRIARRVLPDRQQTAALPCRPSSRNGPTGGWRALHRPPPIAPHCSHRLAQRRQSRSWKRRAAPGGRIGGIAACAAPRLFRRAPRRSGRRQDSATRKGASAQARANPTGVDTLSSHPGRARSRPPRPPDRAEL